MMNKKHTSQEAINASQKGQIEDWIHDILLNSDNNNIHLSEGLKRTNRFFIGPIKVPLSNFKRIAGPEEDMPYRINEEFFNYRVQKMMDEIEKGWDVPPLLIEYIDDKFLLSDGNHRYEALLRLNKLSHYVIFWCTESNEHKKLLNLLDKYRD